MSLLLRRTIPSVAKAGCRRPLPAITTTESCFSTTTSIRSRWLSSSSSSSTLSSLAGSFSASSNRYIDGKVEPRDDSLQNRRRSPDVAHRRQHLNLMATGVSDLVVTRSRPTLAEDYIRASNSTRGGLSSRLMHSLEPSVSQMVLSSFHPRLSHDPSRERVTAVMTLRTMSNWTDCHADFLNQYCRRMNYQRACLSTHRNLDDDDNDDETTTTTTRRDIYSRRSIKKTKIPTPPSGPQPQSMKPEDIMEEINKKSKSVVLPALVSASQAVLMFLLKLPMNTVYYMTHPSEARERWEAMKTFIKTEIDHYWVGAKLLWADLKTARALMRRTLRGSSLTRRERKQLLRTISDLFRLIPFSMFIIIPMMEFALPLALKVFPNLLPSTFQDSLKAEENMKRELQVRIGMAKFFQDTLEELAKDQKRSASVLKQEIKESGEAFNLEETVVAKQEESAASLLEFMEKARNGEVIPNDVIVRYAHYFKDTLTLDNMPRMQLINMCKYMSIPPYGNDSFLRFQLRHRMKKLKEDDQRILWEGIDSLTKMELREACQERGMRSTGLSKDAYKRALQQWLDLSVKQNVPTSLLIMSRTFFLREEMFESQTDDGSKSLAGLADAISGLDKEVVNEVILDVATSLEKKTDPGVRKIKLEVLMKQNELIAKEHAERKEAAAKKKEMAEKEKLAAEDSSPVGVDKKRSSDDASAVRPRAPVPGRASSDQQTCSIDSKDSKAEEEKEHLSTAEMDAISQLVSADPVSKERAELESIKAAMIAQSDTSEKSVSLKDTLKIPVEQSKTDAAPISKEPDRVVAQTAANIVEEAARLVEAEASTSTQITFDAGSGGSGTKKDATVPVSAPPDDPVVARLKKRIESMVDKIEVQLSDVQVKIGAKLHVLDKDMDGILSVDEIADALQQVFKREITFEEAREIAEQMDANKDGDLTVQELIEWVETNQLVKFVEEGRDADMDRIIEKKASSESTDHKDESGSAVPPKAAKSDQ